MKRLAPAILVTVTALGSSVSAEPSSSARALLENLRRTTGAPSVSAAVARGGKIVFSQSVGLADLESGTAATPETLYDIGSVSKAITAVAVTQLIGAGKVRLEDPIQKYVPSFPDKGSPITVWNLLTHTSGIRHYRIHDFPGPDWEENYASGGMISTADDLARLGVALNHDRLFAAEAKRQMLSPQLSVIHRFREDGPPATENFTRGCFGGSSIGPTVDRSPTIAERSTVSTPVYSISRAKISSSRWCSTSKQAATSRPRRSRTSFVLPFAT